MSKNMMIVVVIVIVVLIGGAMLMSQNRKPAQPSVPSATTESSAPTQAVEEKKATEAMEKEDDAIMEKTTIETKNFAFVNKTYTIKAGESVTFKNLDIPGHSVTSDDGKSFDTGVVGKDQTATFKAPAKAGSYPFHCTPHPNMKATLIIE